MAGIGFRLHALIAKGSYLEAATAYLSSAVISAGPWMAGVAALIALNSTSLAYLSPSDHSLLIATMVALFAVSLLLAGGPQLVITRYLADRLYVKDTESLAPTCAGALLLVVPLSLITLPFLLFAPFDLLYRSMVFTLLITLTMIWIMMMFLSAAREHISILLIFILSYVVGTFTSLLLGHLYRLIGTLAGFTFGQVVCLSCLIMLIYREFPSSQNITLAYLRYFIQYWDIAVLGVLYTLSIWVDSAILWFSSRGEVIHGFYHLAPPLDTSKFLMFLSTIPSGVVFMVYLETYFYRHYRRYYRLLQKKGTLDNLMQSREGMQTSIRKGMVQMLKVQGFLTLFLCLIASDLARWVGLAPQWVPLLCIEMLAGIGQYIVFIFMLLLLYIDQRKPAMLLIGIYVILASVLSLLSLLLSESLYSLGYLVASVICAFFGWFLVKNRLHRLRVPDIYASAYGVIDLASIQAGVMTLKVTCKSH